MENKSKIQSLLLCFYVTNVLFNDCICPNCLTNYFIDSIDVYGYILLVLGTITWIVWIYFEVVGSAQLKKFVKTRTDRTKIIPNWLMKYTRHPNYFGEALM